MYHGKDFDLAGFAVGIAEKDEMNRLPHVKAGDILIALPSSLGAFKRFFFGAKKLFFDKLGYTFETEFNGKPLIETLLTPTRIYETPFKTLKDKINALAHITGGGIVENTTRFARGLYKHTFTNQKLKPCPCLTLCIPVRRGSEMHRTFNMGVGMILVVSPEKCGYGSCTK